MRKLEPLILVGTVLAAALLTQGAAQAKAPPGFDGYFIVFSQRGGWQADVDVFPADNHNASLQGGGLAVVSASQVHRFYISKQDASKGVWVRVDDGGRHHWEHTYKPLDRNVCIRQTVSGAIHEATDKPCTDK